MKWGRRSAVPLFAKFTEIFSLFSPIFSRKITLRFLPKRTEFVQFFQIVSFFLSTQLPQLREISPLKNSGIRDDLRIAATPDR